MRKVFVLIAAVALAACGEHTPETPAHADADTVLGPERSSMSASSSGYQPNAGVPTGCANDALLCANFDGGSQLPKGWRASNADTVAVSTDQAYSGSQSLKVTGSGGGYNQNFLIYDLTQIPELSASLHGRMMIRLSSENARSGDFTFIQAQGQARPASGAPVNTTVMYRARVDGRHDHLMANYDTWNDDGTGQNVWSTDCWSHPESMAPPPQDYLIPKDEWACVQWHFDANVNSLRFWLNGEALRHISVTNTGDGCLDVNTQDGVWWGAESFSAIGLGIEQYHSSAEARVMYIDDVAIDTQPLDCPG